MGSRSLRFAEAARLLGDAARRGGLCTPTFRSPPRLLGRDRSLRRRADGSVAVAVQLNGRPFVAVVADMIDGVVVANRLEGSAADQARRVLWAAVAPAVGSEVTDAA